MTIHSPMKCVWRNYVRPLFVTGRLNCDVKDDDGDQIMKNNATVMQNYIMNSGNVDIEDFKQWLRYGKNKGDKNMRDLYNYINENNYGTFEIGPLGLGLLIFVPLSVMAILGTAAITGIGVWLK